MIRSTPRLVSRLDGNSQCGIGPVDIAIGLKQRADHIEAVFGSDITGGPDCVGPVEIVTELGQSSQMRGSWGWRVDCIADVEVLFW